MESIRWRMKKVDRARPGRPCCNWEKEQVQVQRKYCRGKEEIAEEPQGSASGPKGCQNL